MNGSDRTGREHLDWFESFDFQEQRCLSLVKPFAR